MDFTPEFFLLLLLVLLFQVLVFLIYVIILRWIFRINDIANALQELAYYKKFELERDVEDTEEDDE